MERKKAQWHCALFREFCAAFHRQFWTVWTPQSDG
jgi:hypothetical protein